MENGCSASYTSSVTFRATFSSKEKASVAATSWEQTVHLRHRYRGGSKPLPYGKGHRCCARKQKAPDRVLFVFYIEVFGKGKVPLASVLPARTSKA